MNERIKELAEQVYGSAHHDDFKFAELIVKECCPPRPWVGLTDEDLIELSESGLYLWELWKAIEAKLKEKNT
jgi:hypothetical protein